MIIFSLNRNKQSSLFKKTKAIPKIFFEENKKQQKKTIVDVLIQDNISYKEINTDRSKLITTNIDNKPFYYNSTYVEVINSTTGTTQNGCYGWQGIRILEEDIYLLSGTTYPVNGGGQGVVYSGNISCTNGSTYMFVVPGSEFTSVYGPDFNKTNGIFTLVGSYTNSGSSDNYGFIYQGNLNSDSLASAANYTTQIGSSISINGGSPVTYDITFLHSTMNGYVVGSSGTSTSNISYIYNISTASYIQVKFPLSSTTTTYGIWHTHGTNYIIVGGYSNNTISLYDIYKDNKPISYGKAFIAEFNSELNIIYNYTTVPFNDNPDFVTHIQGISGFNNIPTVYSLAYDVVDIKDGLIKGYYTKIKKNKNNFVTNDLKFIEFNYPTNFPNITPADSVAENTIVGFYTGTNHEGIEAHIACQAYVSDYTLSSSVSYQHFVLPNKLILFDKQFINENINYTNGIYTFITPAVYEINFTIYLAYISMPFVSLKVEYLINNKKQHFIVSQKGIGKKSTEHSIIIPCTFSNKFYNGDTFSVKNVSQHKLLLMPSFLNTSIGSIISINLN